MHDLNWPIDSTRIAQHSHAIEGNTQQGEVNVAELAGVKIEYVYY